jgi:hypothetical protein
MLPGLRSGRSSLNSCAFEKHRACVWTTRCNGRLTITNAPPNVFELADSSFDPGIEAHYRSLAGRYLKLAESEEDFGTRGAPLSP